MGLTLSCAGLQPLAYLRVFKCGNNAVRCNMRGCCYVTTGGANSSTCVDDIPPEQIDAALISNLRSRNFTFFTAVREPVEKFIGGLVEMCGRMARISPDDPYCPRYFDSKSPLADFLSDLLSATQSRTPMKRWLFDGDIRHIATMTSAVRPVVIDTLADTRDLPTLWDHVHHTSASTKVRQPINDKATYLGQVQVLQCLCDRRK
ncbi:hypothetical protein FOA52_008466 [Chlamydomonas sp. UWO 241]|nr:hypothetical protein FOA52_008466 [Chlamydomonas sp. UWO 241]